MEQEVKWMAYGNCCEDCRHGEYKPKEETHLGAREYDVYCWYYRKWVGTGSCGGCKNFEEK